DPLSTDLSSAIVNPLQTQPKAQADSAVSNIMHVISSNLQAPVNSSNDMSVLTLRLDSKGNVLTASAKGSNPALNNAAENAAYKSSPLPIDLRHPDQFRNVIIKIRAN
ncbi:MAG: hypothetical protein Q4P13_12530, partial [Psychrobacter sp.]|nr:hypothetical protein [Psychrobacter sp.]